MTTQKSDSEILSDLRRKANERLTGRISELEEVNALLLEACENLLEYRFRVGSLGFQLEKADHFIDQIRAAITKATKGNDDE